MGVFVYSVNSKFKQMLDIKLACTADAEGNAECEDTEDGEPPTKKQNTGQDPQSSNQDPQSSTQGAADQNPSADPVNPPSAQQCGASCYHHADCDSASGCLCANYINPDHPPVDSTFRPFSCKYVPNLAAAIAAANALGTACRGRCLLANTTGDNATYSNTTFEIMDQPDQTPTTDFGALECPCNCTYVSPACCLSTDGIVYEDALARSQISVQAPPDTGFCCDTTTGLWRDPGTSSVGNVTFGSTACPLGQSTNASQPVLPSLIPVNSTTYLVGVATYP